MIGLCVEIVILNVYQFAYKYAEIRGLGVRHVSALTCWTIRAERKLFFFFVKKIKMLNFNLYAYLMGNSCTNYSFIDLIREHKIE